jgi:DNA-binding MarR family transcriptional regulator
VARLAVLVTMTAPATRPEAAVALARGDEYACARAWVALTAAHARIAGLLNGALARTCGLSTNEFEILLRVDHTGPPGMRLGSLNTAVPLTQPSLSRAVARLAGRGWLSRAGAPGDRRGVVVTLTPAGQEALRRAIPVHARTIREHLIDPLAPDELKLLSAALSRIADS